MSIIRLLFVSTWLIFTGCGRLATEAEALQAAKERFSKVCANFNYAPSSFNGPLKTNVGGAAFAYEWKERKPESDFGILITVDETGYTNVSFVGTLPQEKAYSKDQRQN